MIKRYNKFITEKIDLSGIQVGDYVYAKMYPDYTSSFPEMSKFISNNIGIIDKKFFTSANGHPNSYSIKYDISGNKKIIDMLSRLFIEDFAITLKNEIRFYSDNYDDVKKYIDNIKMHKNIKKFNL